MICDRCGATPDDPDEHAVLHDRIDRLFVDAVLEDRPARPVSSEERRENEEGE